jgi:hypothetical protein
MERVQISKEPTLQLLNRQKIQDLNLIGRKLIIWDAGNETLIGTGFFRIDGSYANGCSTCYFVITEHGGNKRTELF